MLTRFILPWQAEQLAGEEVGAQLCIAEARAESVLRFRGSKGCTDLLYSDTSCTWLCLHGLTPRCAFLCVLQAEQLADEDVGAAQLRIAEAEAETAAAHTERDTAEAAMAAAKQQLAAARAEASRLGVEVETVKQAAEAQLLDSQQQLAAKDR